MIMMMMMVGVVPGPGPALPRSASTASALPPTPLLGSPAGCCVPVALPISVTRAVRHMNVFAFVKHFIGTIVVGGLAFHANSGCIAAALHLHQLIFSWMVEGYSA